MSVTNEKGVERPDASVKTSAVDLKDLVVAYAKQETVDPLRSLVQYLKWGLVGTVLTSIGVVIGAVAAVRLVQTETGGHLGGNLSFIPYLAGVVFVLAFVAFALRKITRGR